MQCNAKQGMQGNEEAMGKKKDRGNFFNHINNSLLFCVHILLIVDFQLDRQLTSNAHLSDCKSCYDVFCIQIP